METPERVPWVWIVHQLGSQSVSTSAALFSHFSGCFAWVKSVTQWSLGASRIVGPGWCSAGLNSLSGFYWHSEDNQWERLKGEDKVLTACAPNVYSLLIDTTWKCSTSLLFKGYNTYDILKVPQLNKLGEVTFEPSIILFIQFAIVRSWGWHARLHRMPPVEHTASRLFVQLGTADVSGAKRQIPVQNTAGLWPMPNHPK